MVTESCMKEASNLEPVKEDGGIAFNLLDRLDITDLSITDDSSHDGSDTSNHCTVTERPSARSVMRATWRVVLATSALLDCLSTLLHERLMIQPCEKDGDGECVLGKVAVFGQEYSLTNPQLLDLLVWLDQNAVYFGFAFSLLWCVQSFRDAQETRRRALRERDKKRLLNRGESIRSLPDSDDLVKSGYFGGVRPWLAFYSTLIVQLLLVPLGFYVLLYQGFKVITADSSNQMHEIVEELESSSDQDKALQAILNSTYQVVETSMANHNFTKNARLSVVMLLARNAGNAFMNALGAKLKKWAVRKGLKEGRKLGVRAIVSPHKVWRQARKAIKWARWTKYLAPLLATSNKLRENVCDLLKKYRQRREAILAMKIRMILWEKMTPEERKSKAAKCIQSCWRSYRVRRARWALALIQCHRDEVAAIRVQTMLRSLLHRARARIRQKREELKELEARERLAVRGDRRMTMSPYDRKRLYQLQDEMRTTKTKSIDRRLLLRPNTRFAVVWKSIFVFCVIIEIADLALAEHKVKGKPATVSNMLQDVLIPPPVSSLKACSCYAREREEFNSRILARMRPTRCPSDPWFCGSPFSTAQTVYSSIMQLILNHFMVIVGIICFLDVPIYHYTGEIDGETGALIPKGFFDRWIAPGLLLQLLVNPEMESTSKLIFHMLTRALEIGPIRVLRWIEALFYPCLVLVVDLIENHVWVPAVAHVNRNKVEPSVAEEEEAPPAVRRRTSIMRRASIVTSQRRCSLVGCQPRWSSLMIQPRKSSLVPMGSSSIASFARARRSACCFPSRTPLMEVKEKEL